MSRPCVNAHRGCECLVADGRENEECVNCERRRSSKRNWKPDRLRRWHNKTGLWHYTTEQCLPKKDRDNITFIADKADRTPPANRSRAAVTTQMRKRA